MGLANQIKHSQPSNFSPESCQRLIDKNSTDKSYINVKEDGVSPLEAAITANRPDLVLLLLYHRVKVTDIDHLLSRLFNIGFTDCYQSLIDVSEKVLKLGEDLTSYFTTAAKEQLLTQWRRNFSATFCGDPEFSERFKERYAQACLLCLENGRSLAQNYRARPIAYHQQAIPYQRASRRTEPSGLTRFAAVSDRTVGPHTYKAQQTRQPRFLTMIHEYGPSEAEFERQLKQLSTMSEGDFSKKRRAIQLEIQKLLIAFVLVQFHHEHEVLQALFVSDSSYKKPVLVHAILAGHDEVIALLAESGMPLSGFYAGTSYLDLAIVNGCGVETIKLLLDAVDVATLHAEGSTPLHKTVMFNRDGVIAQLLLQKDPSLLSQPNDAGETPMLLAIRYHSYFVGYVLCKHQKPPLDMLMTSLTMPYGYAYDNGMLKAYLRLLIERDDFDTFKFVLESYYKRLGKTTSRVTGCDSKATLLQLFDYGSPLVHVMIKNNALDFIRYVETIGGASKLCEDGYLKAASALGVKGLVLRHELFNIGCRQLRKVGHDGHCYDLSRYMEWLAKFCDKSEFEEVFYFEYQEQKVIIDAKIAEDEEYCHDALVRVKTLAQKISKLGLNPQELLEDVKLGDPNYKLKSDYQTAFSDSKSYPVLAEDSRRVYKAIQRMKLVRAAVEVPAAAREFRSHQHHHRRIGLFATVRVSYGQQLHEGALSTVHEALINLFHLHRNSAAAVVSPSSSSSKLLSAPTHTPPPEVEFKFVH